MMSSAPRYVLRLGIVGVETRGEPQRVDRIGERPACRSIVGDDLLRGVGETQHGSDAVVAHGDDQANSPPPRVSTRREFARLVVAIQRRGPPTGEDDGGVEHLGDRTRRRIEQLVHVCVFGEERDSQRAIGVRRDAVGIDDRDPVQAGSRQIEAVERQMQAVLDAGCKVKWCGMSCCHDPMCAHRCGNGHPIVKIGEVHGRLKAMSARPLTLAQKVWDRHVVTANPGEPELLYIDLHLVHEVTSPQAFDGLRINGRGVRRPDLTVATEDHNVPTADIHLPVADPISARQLEVLRANADEFGITLYPMGDPRQGIVHVIGPEQGRTLPGMTIVCGDSHTSTHGAFGALAFGIGTSEVEHVLATQTLPQSRPKWMSVTVDGTLDPSVTAKDIVLAIIGKIGTGGGIGHVIEYRGSAIRGLSMEGRMTVCNMSIEAGAKAGLIAPDETTFAYLKGREFAPKGADWDAAVADWSTLRTDDGATFDTEVFIDASTLTPHVTWGTNPAQVLPINGRIPDPKDFADATARDTVSRALEYMGLTAGTALRDIEVDTVFIGSCTNSRIEDLRAAAAVVKGRKVRVKRAMVVPGSHQVKNQAIAEGLDRIFVEAGLDWREPGCSMCLAMNPDKLAPGERAASTSNRNFEGRQGRGGRTHLVSPAVAAATAIAGHFATPEDLK